MQAYDRCTIGNCRRPPVLTYLDARLCQRCWERACEKTNDAEAAAAESAVTTNDRPDQDGAEESEMSKNASKKTKTSKLPKPAKGSKTKPDGSQPKPPKEAKPKRPSALNAAAEVLAKAGKPMRSSEMIAAMAEQKLWTSPGGKTPQATLYAAIVREIRDKKAEARFKKVDRGQFAANR